MNIKMIVWLALLAALAVVLKMMAIVVLNNRLIFHNIPIIIASITFGPIYGMICAIVADIGAIPTTANWNIFFMIPQLLWGLIPGLFRKRRLWLIEITTYFLVSLGNTVCLWLLYGRDVAFGIVRIKQVLAFNFLNHSYEIVIGEVIYLRIVLVIVIMAIKVPLDVLILRKIFRYLDNCHS